MTYAIPLIDKSDGVELVRDKIAEILATETALQQALATGQSLDPALWTFKVYAERVNPWESFYGGDDTPIVNVWFDTTVFDLGASNLSTRQTARPSRFNVDVYTTAVSCEDGSGHSPGDEAAAKRAHHVVKLCRNLLMHDKYINLEMEGIVSKRWVGQIRSFLPTTGELPVQNVAACRLILEVDHLETIDLPDHEVLEIANVKFYHEPDGQIIAELHYEDS